MDKTAQDSLAKKPVDMRDRILEHLEALTSAVSLDDLARLSTSDIAETLIISRSLASQYLNDLVRAGLVVKVAGRPVRYSSSPRVPEAFSGKALCKRVRLARRPHPGDGNRRSP